MAKRGVRPKPVALHLVDGTNRTTRHGPEEELKKKIGRPKGSGKPYNKPLMPTDFAGEARKAWDRYIKPAWWLDASREPLAISFCILWKKFKSNPDGFSSSNFAQMRAFLQELGLTDERNRGDQEPESTDDFFDDD